MLRRKRIQQVIVILGWLIFYSCILVVITPVALGFQDQILQQMPLENLIPAILAILAVGVPIMYSIGMLVLPLLIAVTLEVFDDEH